MTKLIAAWLWLDIGLQEGLLLSALGLLSGGSIACLLGLGYDPRLAWGAGCVICGALLALLAWPARARATPAPGTTSRARRTV